MGTRNLTMVVHGGQVKVAQYGQWDGYPEGTGKDILRFLRDGFMREQFVENLGRAVFITSEEEDSLLLPILNQAIADKRSEAKRQLDHYATEGKSDTEEASRLLGSLEALKPLTAGQSWINMAQSEVKSETFPALHRNIGGKVLKFIQDSKEDPIYLHDERSFANESLFCEWAYVVDLDNNYLEVYRGFNEAPLEEGERFFPGEPLDDEYQPVKFVTKFDIGALPSDEDFLAKIKGLVGKDD